MQTILNLLNINGLTPELKNRLVLSSFCLLIFCILIYFWAISRSKIKANNKDGNGLVYLAFAFLLYFLIGFISVYNPVQQTYLIISGLISLCYLWSLSYFSIGINVIDTIVSNSAWRNGVKYIGLAWIIVISLASGLKLIEHLDIAIQVLALSLLGVFIIRYFIQRGLNFIALVSGGYFAIFILLQIHQPTGLSEGKFIHLNSIVLGPALPLSVIVMAYTFNWINELNFYELSNIWVGTDRTPAEDKAAYAKLTKSANSDTWKEKIASDEIEQVIDEMIILKKHRNENLEVILSIASQNTRNNNNQLKGIISYEDYQLNRNKVSNSLVSLMGG